MNLDEANTVVAQAQTIYPGFAATLVPSGAEPDRAAHYVVTLSHGDGFTMTIDNLQVWLNHLRDMVRPTVRMVASSHGSVAAGPDTKLAPHARPSPEALAAIAAAPHVSHE